jgi:hypothetical protein
MAENAVQMVQRIPSPRGDKNGADINLALDALEMAFTHAHVNAFAIVSGDSDFIPLVNKLKEYGKTVFVAANGRSAKIGRNEVNVLLLSSFPRPCHWWSVRCKYWSAVLCSPSLGS